MKELSALHHVGITVPDLDRAVTFWGGLLESEPLWRRMLDAPYLGEVTGYPHCRIEVAMFRLAGETRLELLRYLEQGEANMPETARPGNVHIALSVGDIWAVWRRALTLGATPTSRTPIEVTSGANEGALACYLRSPEGVTIELIEPAPERRRAGASSRLAL